MKRTLTLLVFLSCFHFAKAQAWAAPGATWYYNFVYFSQTGYERIQNTGDTVINSKQYNKLQIYRLFYDASNGQTGSYYEPQLEFTREDSGVVYAFHDSADFVLYDFNTPAGGNWTTHGNWPIQTGMCDTGSVHVDSVGTIVINGDTLRELFMSSTGMLSFQGPIIEKIGCTGYLFPHQGCVTDVPEGYGLRCYYDSTGWTYHDPGNAAYVQQYGCGFVLNVNDPSVNSAVSLFPDPVNDVLHLSFLSMNFMTVQISIRDEEGRTVRSLKLDNAENDIDVNDLSPGIYFIISPYGEFAPVKFAVAK